MNNKAKTIGKQHLSFTLQQAMNMSVKDADTAVEAIFSKVEKELLKGNSVSLVNIGSMKAVPKKTGQIRKAFGTDVVVKKCVNIQFSTSLTFVDNYRRTGGKGDKELQELEAFKKGLG